MDLSFVNGGFQSQKTQSGLSSLLGGGAGGMGGGGLGGNMGGGIGGYQQPVVQYVQPQPQVATVAYNQFGQ